MAEELKTLKEKYEEYLNLNYVKSRFDPDEEPYKTKYEARKIIDDVTGSLSPNLNNSIDQNPSEFMISAELKHLIDTYEFFYNKLDPVVNSKYSMSAKSFLIKKLFEFNLAKNFIETEEIETGEKLLAKIIRELDSLEILDDSKEPLLYNPLLFNLKLSCFNEMIFVWSHRADYKKSLSLLLQIDSIYETYQKESSKNFVSNKDTKNENNTGLVTAPFNLNELIHLNKEFTIKKRADSFEALYTHSLFFFAQVYGKLDDKEKSAYYCELTLQRQLDRHNEAVEVCTKENMDDGELFKIIATEDQQERVLFDPLDWATHAGAISQYYVCESDFATARHCLCCAEAILRKLHEDFKSSKISINEERLNEQTQSIRRCWGKYALELLKLSKQKLIESADQPDQKSLLSELDRPSKFRFNLPLSIYKLDECEKNAISANIALDFEQARKIFLKAQAILNETKEYFKLDGYVTDHCEIVRDLSELYAGLMFFEEDPERRCKMMKRRLDLVTPICSEISEQYYLTLKRQYLFDIGTLYSEMMDLKVDIFKSKKEGNSLNTQETASAVLKINQLASQSIEHFDKFLDTMKVQPKREVLPDKFDDHNVRPALLAKFYIGRLYSKIITIEPAKRLANIKNTFDCYSYLVDYCDKEQKDDNASVMDRMEVEYSICKEMVVFLPAQMEKIRSTI
jgi:hypothetical protein